MALAAAVVDRNGQVLLPAGLTLAENHIESLRRRGIGTIVDFVPHHTSDSHPWFREARSSRSSPRRDWYLWRDPAPGGGPPNNWLSQTDGPAWTLDPATDQY